ncbi:MAG: hypothetical protein QOH60_893 [Mycobacterium sp.]|nr:hypothetical protein [Mycobacterium sp.]
MAFDKLAAGETTNDATTFTTSAITPGADRLLVAFVVSASVFGPTIVPTVSSNGVNWTLLDSVAANNRMLSCFVRRGGAPGTVVIDFPNQGQTLCAWSILETDAAPGDALAVVSQHSTDGPRNVGALSVALTPPLGLNEAAVGALVLDGSRVVTAGPGCTSIDAQAPADVFASATLHSEERSTAGDLGWTWGGGNANAAAIVLVVKRPAPQGPQPFNLDETLIRKYEPILTFDPAEASFPSDAKRYLEHCALWSADWPFLDDTRNWKQLVPAGSLAAVPGEAGKTFVTDPLKAVSKPEEAFLELGGWRDANDTPQPFNEAGPLLRYANRAEVRSSYSTDPVLKDSQFWYHAEYFDTTRLLHVAESEQILYRIATGLKHPSMICYYLFFPDHEQAVTGENFEAREVGGYVGQWACFAVLLQRADAQDEPKPHFIGLTTAPLSGQAAPESDDEHRIFMKAEPWRSLPGQPGAPALPEKIDGHPHLFVSRGNHNLSVDNKPHEVAPFPYKPPYEKGEYDGQPYQFEDNDDLTLFWIKIGASPLVLPAIAAGIEALFLDTGVHEEYFGEVDSVPPDPAPGLSGITVHPAGLAPRNEWKSPRPWRTAQGLRVGDRRYDFVVDRLAQPWWPSDNGNSGYRGRWGQRVERDKLPRRAGVRFPRFWRMFLLAYEAAQQ